MSAGLSESPDDRLHARAGCVVGGLGSPHDRFVAAALSGLGVPTMAFGELDAEALELGRPLVPRGACAPLLYTTGALARHVRTHDRSAVRLVALSSCGPCRFALFPSAWRYAMQTLGVTLDVNSIVDGGATALELAQTLLGRAIVGAIIAADLVSESARRERPCVLDVAELEAARRGACARIEAGLLAGEPAEVALARARGWSASLARAREAPRARACLVGDPWSMHVNGDGQLDVPEVLSAMGIETLVAPSSLWLDYLYWQLRSERPDQERAVRAAERALSTRRSELAHALDVPCMQPPSIDELARLVGDRLDPQLRGGYGHVELGLALHASERLGVDLVVSVKSFGCIPSAGITDALLPSAVGRRVPVLSLELTGDGDVSPQSRLILFASAALAHAERMQTPRTTFPTMRNKS